MDYSTLKNNNKYDVNKIAELIVAGKIPIGEILDFVKDDYTTQAKKLREEASQIMDALVASRFDYLKSEGPERSLKFRQSIMLSEQFLEMNNLMIKTFEDIIMKMMEKYEKMLK